MRPMPIQPIFSVFVAMPGLLVRAPLYTKRPEKPTATPPLRRMAAGNERDREALHRRHRPSRPKLTLAAANVPSGWLSAIRR